MNINATLAVSAVALLAACGGGGGSTSNVPPTQNPPPADPYVSNVLFRPATNPAGGLEEFYNNTTVYIAATANSTQSDGLNLHNPYVISQTYSDLSSGTDRDTTAFTGEFINYANSNWGMTGGGTRVSQMPTGSFTYNGFSVFYSTETVAVMNQQVTYKTLGTAQIGINFSNGTGTVSAVSNDGTRALSGNVSSIFSGGGFSGSGTFTSQNRQDTYPSGPHNNPDGARGNISTTSVTGITEASEIYGNFHGPNATELTAISAGNNHTVGIIASR